MKNLLVKWWRWLRQTSELEFANHEIEASAKQLGNALGVINSQKRQIDSLQQQVRVAARATNEMGAESRRLEVEAHYRSLAQAQERERNRNLPGYTVVPDDQVLLDKPIGKLNLQ